MVWKRLKDMVELQRPKDKKELRQAIEMCWDQIPMKFIRSCIQGLTDKMSKALRDADEKIEVDDESDDDGDDESFENDYDSLDDLYTDEEDD